MAKKRIKKEEKKTFLARVKEKFTLSYWKHNYSMAGTLLVLCIFWYRGTTDGLWFIFAGIILFTRRLELYTKFDFPLAFWKKENTTLREFGYARAFTSIFWAKAAIKPYRNDPFIQLICYTIFIIFILHIYISIIIIFHTVMPHNADVFFTYISSRFNFLLNNWPAYMSVENKLISHGYENRVPIIKHVYLSCIFASIYNCILYIISFFKSEYVNDNILKTNVDFFGGTIKNKNNNKFIYFINELYHFILLILGFLAFSFFLYKCTVMPILYPGEPLPRHGLYNWVTSYAYKDYLALFYPSYVIIWVAWFAFGGFIVISSIIYFKCKNTIKWLLKIIIRMT